MTEQIPVVAGQEAAFAERDVRHGKDPVAPPDIADMTRFSVWDIKNHPRNVRKHNLQALADSIRAFGQQSPVVVQMSTGFVVKGNGTLKVARDILGWGHIYGSAVEMDDDTALRYLIADNRTSDLADYDKAAQAKLLKELEGSAKGLQDTIWTPDEAEDLWAEMGQITITDPEQFKGGYAETPEELAARAEKRALKGDGKKEVVLLLGDDDYAAFTLNIAKLSRAYGTKGVIATVLRAVQAAADQVVS